MPSPLPSARAWPAAAAPQADGRPAARQKRLVAAVAGIVALAAERARAAGDLGALREAIERALDSAAPPAADPREPVSPDLPRITDADPSMEEGRLRALLGRLRAG